jgi:preprotein translocase subunit SecE
VNDIIVIILWVALIGAVFGFAWRRGYLLRITAYVGETREELKKCTWPTTEELKGSTLVVLVATLLLGGFTIGVDFIAAQIVRLLLSFG